MPTEAKVEEVAVLRITATSSRSTSNALDELPRELAMLRRPSITSDECRRRAKKAQTLAAQTQDDWEKELLHRITTQWHVLAIHKKGKEENTPEATQQWRDFG